MMSARIKKAIDEGTPVLFLDVDGVLNRYGSNNNGLDGDKLLLLQRVIEMTGCAIVISSTWRKWNRTMDRLVHELLKIGANIIGVTPELDQSRGKEIDAWIAQMSFTGKFVILDDDPDMEPLHEHHVQTNPYQGLTSELVDVIYEKFK